MDSEFLISLKKHLDVFEKEYSVIVILNHRNRNQHRVAKWWKFFNIFKRKTYDIIKQLSALLSGNITNARTVAKNVADLYKTIRYFIKKQSKAIYYSLNGIIQLGQFVTLGVVLVGLFAKIYDETLKLQDLIMKSPYFVPSASSVPAKTWETENKLNQVADDSNMNTGIDELADELGEEIMEQVDELVTTPPQKLDVQHLVTVTIDKVQSNTDKKTKNKKKNISKKKKSSKNAIDDIFG